MAKDAELKPVYLILSEQKMLVDEALTRLKKRVGETGDLDFNMQTFDAENSSADDVIAACNTMPFMADYRLVILRGIEKLNKEASDAITAYAADPASFAVLALAGEKLAKNTRLYKAVESLGGIVDRKLEKKDFPAQVRRMFEDRGKKIALDVAEEFIDAVGFDLRRLSAEVDKAIAFVGDRPEVTRADVEGVVSTTAPTSIWEFVEALGDRDCKRALTKASDLIAEGESVFSLRGLALRNLRDLLAVRALLDRGITSPGGMVSYLGRQEWQIRRLVRQARGFHAEELVRLHRMAAEGDVQIRTSRDERLVLERWIVSICG